MATYNSERGEVPLTVGGVDLVIAATMQGLATVSGRLKCQSFSELYSKMANVEINAVIVGVEALAVKGDVGAAMKALTLKDLPACRDAFIAALAHSVKDQSGNAEAAGGETTASPGGSGNASPSGT